MKKSLICLLVVGVMFSFVSCGEKNKKVDESNKSSIEDKKGESIKFNKKEPLKIEEIPEIDNKKIDINKDGVEDEIILLGKGDKYNLSEAYIAIKDGASEEQLTNFKGNKMQTNFNDFYDLTGDGVFEIIVDYHSDTKEGGGTTVYEYKDGEYIESKCDDSKMEYSFEDDNYLVVKESSSKTVIKRKISGEVLEKLKSLKVFDESGKVVHKEVGEIKLINMTLEDLDKDGKKDLVGQHILKLKNEESVSLIDIEVIYEYKDGKFQVKGILDKLNFEKKIENYEKESKSEEKSASSVKENINKDNAKIMLEGLKEIQSANYRLEYTENELGQAEKYKKDYHIFFAYGKNETGEEEFAAQSLYAVNKSTKEIFVILPDQEPIAYKKFINGEF